MSIPRAPLHEKPYTVLAYWFSGVPCLKHGKLPDRRGTFEPSFSPSFECVIYLTFSSAFPAGDGPTAVAHQGNEFRPRYSERFPFRIDGGILGNHTMEMVALLVHCSNCTGQRAALHQLRRDQHSIGFQGRGRQCHGYRRLHTICKSSQREARSTISSCLLHTCSFHLQQPFGATSSPAVHPRCRPRLLVGDVQRTLC